MNDVIVPNQKVKVKWNNRLAKYYLSKGYQLLKPNEEFEVHIDDLPEMSNQKVFFECDTCGNKKLRSYAQLKQQQLHFCSKECKKNCKIYSKEQLINEFFRFYEEKGYYPQQNDMKVQNGYPSYYYYIKLWGSWKNFIDELGIYDESGWLKQDIETLKIMYETESKEKIMESLIDKYSWEYIRVKARSLGLKRKVKTENPRKLSKEFLISEFWRYYNEYGVYPMLKDLQNTPGYPSEAGYKRIWGSWDNFLKDIGVVDENNDDGWYKCDEQVLIDLYEEGDQQEIIDKLMVKRLWGQIKKKANKMGLKRNKSKIKRIYSDDFLLSELKRYYEEHNEVPTSLIFDSKDNNYPSSNVYMKRFGSWNNALKKAGLELNLIKYYTKEEIVKEAVNFYKKYGRSPYYYELSYSSGLISNNWGNWTNFLKACNLPLNKREVFLETKEKGIKFLQYLYRELNKIPTTFDVEEHGIHKGWFAEKFGSFKLALYEAGLISYEEAEADYDKWIVNNINYLKELANKIKRVPSVKEYEDYLKTKEIKNYLSRENLCRKLNKTFVEICEEYLDKNILESENNHFYINKNEERCMSYAEKAISNLLINNDIKYEYQPLYKDVIDINKKYRFDWKIFYNDKEIYVEYFGMFNHYNDEISKSYREKAFEKIKICKENGIKLISFFPDDLEDNYKGVINKFKEYGIIINNVSVI